MHAQAKNERKVECELEKKSRKPADKVKSVEDGATKLPSQEDTLQEKSRKLATEDSIQKLQKEIIRKKSYPMQTEDDATQSAAKPESDTDIPMDEVSPAIKEEDKSIKSPQKLWLKRNKDVTIVDCINRFTGKFLTVDLSTDINLTKSTDENIAVVKVTDIMDAMFAEKPAALYHVDHTTKNTLLHILAENYITHDDGLEKFEFLILKMRARGLMVNAEGTTAIHRLFSEPKLSLKEGLNIVGILEKVGLQRILLRKNRHLSTPLFSLFEKSEICINNSDFEPIIKCINLIHSLDPNFFNDKSPYKGCTRLGFLYATILQRVAALLSSDEYELWDIRYLQLYSKICNGFTEILKLISEHNLRFKNKGKFYRY